MAKAYKAKWIITAANEGEQVYEDSALIVENGIITDIIPNDDVYEEVFDEVKDYRNSVITPGFINLYSKLQFTNVFKTESKGFKSAIKRFFISWHKFFSMLGVQKNTYPMKLANIYKEYFCFNKKEKIDSLKNGLMKSLLAGTTCIAEITNEIIYFDFLNKLPVKTFIFFELFADNEKNAKKEYKNLKKSIKKLDKKRNNSTYFGVYPHSINTVCKDFWAFISKYTLKNKIPYMTEVLESEEEQKWLNEGKSDFDYLNMFLKHKNFSPETECKSIIDYMEEINALKHNLIVKNGNLLNEKELAQLSQHEIKMVYTPCYNKKYFNKYNSFEKIIKYFPKTTAIATGAVTENENLSLLKELSETNYNLSIEEKIKYITLFPAQILNIDNIIGSIEKGKHADFNVFKLTKKQTLNEIDTVQIPYDVYILGQIVVNKGKL